MLKIPDVPFIKLDLWTAKKSNRNMMEGDPVGLKVNGCPCPVRECRVSTMPFNRVWPGRDHQRSLSQTELAGFALFSADEPVTLELETNEAITDFMVRPLSAKVACRREGRKVTFTLPRPGQYVFEAGGSHHALHLFFDPIGDDEEEGQHAHRWHFGPGVHFPGVIRVESGDTVYLDSGAVVFGSIFGENVENVKILGSGVLDGSCEERVLEHCYETYTKSTVKFYNSRQIGIKGITILNSACWTMNFFGCSDIEIDWIKIVGQWRYNTDGIDLCNTQRVRISNSFVRSFDDTIVLKGVDFDFDGRPGWVAGRPVSEIEVRNCVLWCGWGRTCELGLETAAPEFSRILFENCDLIHNSSIAIDLQNGNYADIHDVVFRNLRVEYQIETLPEIIQRDDKQCYDAAGQRGVPLLIVSENPRFLPNDTRYGSTHDILFDGIHVLTDPGFSATIPIVIHNYSEQACCCNHTFRNMTFNGAPLSENSKEIRLDSIGSVQGTRWEVIQLDDSFF